MLTDVDQIDEQELAAIFGVQSEPQQPQLQRLQAVAAKSQQLIALVDGADKVTRSIVHGFCNMSQAWHTAHKCGGSVAKPWVQRAHLSPLQRRCMQVVDRLQGNVPVLVSGKTWEDTAEELDDLLLGDAEVW